MDKEIRVSIPNDIKLELNAGVLTLKSGSKAYVPNGSVVNTITTASDVTISGLNVNTQYMLFTNTSGTFLFAEYVSSCSSGTSMPAGTWKTWYDTTNKKVKRIGGTAGTVLYEGSLPIAIFTVSGGAITSIDQVFNGFGYIGSTVFALPNIEAENPAGFDENGEPIFKNRSTQNVLVVEKKSEYPYLVGNGDYYTDIYFAKSYNNYVDIANLYIEDKNVINGIPYGFNTIKISPYDLITTKLISQYANSEKLLKLENGLRSMFSNAKLIRDWFNIVYNIKTAKGYGLDIWGKILNKGRNFTYTNQSSGVQTDYYLKGELTVDGTTYTAYEIEETYRKILFMKAMSLITNATEKSINDLLQFYFNGRRVYVIQYDTMKLRYVFEVPVSKLEKSIFTSDLMPKPTGVGATYQYLPKNSYFGFYIKSRPQNDQYWAPFDNKPFYW